jgi:hypothetical protein
VTLLFPGALGDFLLALPTLRALRARHAETPCTIAVGAPLCGLAAHAFPGDATARLDGPELARLLAGGPRPAWLPPDGIVYSWLGATDPAVREQVAAGAASARFFRVERAPGGVHASIAYAQACGTDDDPDGLVERGRILPPASAGADRLAGAPLLVLHPGAGAQRKRWDGAGFAAVVAWWRASGGAAVVLLGPAELDDVAPAAVEALRDLPLPDVAAVLARAALYVGNDSGVSHLAAAVGAPSVVLFGPTDPARWRPLGATVVVGGSSARPDGISLEALPAARVIDACREARALRPTGAAARPERALHLDKGGPRY